jgi:hypothetical protein
VNVTGFFEILLKRDREAKAKAACEATVARSTTGHEL